MVHLIARNSDRRHSSSQSLYSVLEVRMLVNRRLPYWMYNVWLPLFWFTGISFSSLLIEVTWIAFRLSITLSMLLTQVTYRFAIMDRLPEVRNCGLCLRLSAVHSSDACCPLTARCHT